ncbi:MAG TPA: hypothetical protein VEX38_10980, partial [Fimbriimonadaceae bacterium]|nr:hypothetical protein [Fimbriimonadaceae bacterium]
MRSLLLVLSAMLVLAGCQSKDVDRAAEAPKKPEVVQRGSTTITKNPDGSTSTLTRGESTENSGKSDLGARLNNPTLQKAQKRELTEIGVPLYPNSSPLKEKPTMYKEKKGDETHLVVHRVTDDDPVKVLAFYQKEIKMESSLDNKELKFTELTGTTKKGNKIKV